MIDIEIGDESPTGMTYDEALMYCFFYCKDGKTGWRLPTEIEYSWHIVFQNHWHQNDDNLDEDWAVIPVRTISK